MNKLDAFEFPMHGLQLIEASAGTGKTYTLTSLYLKALLLIEKPCSVDQILVVTFTEAATEELRERIRTRLGRVLAQLQQPHHGHHIEDAFEHKLSAHLAMPTDRALAVARLKLALSSLDQAAIMTIHGFCRRALLDNIYDTELLHDAEFELNSKTIEFAVAQDIWRQLCYNTASPQTAQLALRLWPTPNALHSELARLIPRYHHTTLRPEFPASGAMNYITQRITLAHDFIEQHWLSLWDSFDEALWKAQKSGQINKRSFTDTRTRERLEHARLALTSAWNPWLGLPDGIQDLLSSLAQHGANFAHPLLDLFHRFPEQADIHAALRQQALAAFLARYENTKKLRNVITPDDLLLQLERCLLKNQSKRAQFRLKQQYPIAFIDEFQDTDQVQYRIFSHLYQAGDNSALIMIGDPKQAIYRFRGGDIYTYLSAKIALQQTTGSIHSLTTNFRTARDLLTAVQSLFTAHTQEPFGSKDIPFTPVQAHESSQHNPLNLAQGTRAPMQLWCVPESNTPEVETVLFSWAAHEIEYLLAQANINDKALEPKDICILVRNRSEAEKVQQALRQRGIRSAFLGQESILLSQEAFDIYTLLCALQNPTRGDHVRGVWATHLFKRSFAEIESFVSDERQQEQLTQTLHTLHQHIERLGILPVLRRIFSDFDIVSRWLNDPLGERVITNAFQMGELLQQQSYHTRDFSQLLQWLRESLRDADIAREHEQLRLESDEDVISILTIHRSKGLEFPIVFLPWASFGEAKLRDKIPLYHDTQHGLTADLSAPKADADAISIRLAWREQQLEEIRLLYVAVTRAKYRCYLGMAATKNFHQTALASLLGLTQEKVDDDTLFSTLNRIIDANATDYPTLALHRQPPPETASDTRSQRPPLPSDRKARHFRGNIDAHWRITSYTQLTSLLDNVSPAGQAAMAPQPISTPNSWHQLPAGKYTGRLLHHLLELTLKNNAITDMTHIEQTLAHHHISAEFTPTLQQWIHDIITHEIDAGFCLQQLHQNQSLSEFGFTYPTAALHADKFNQLIQQHNPFSYPLTPLRFDEVHGLVKGSIDLIYAYQNQFFILDYKSNRLGYTDEDYHHDAISQAIIEHRYDIQYYLYTLALHRYLKQRLETSYDYNTHFGGVRYLFLRGLRGPERGIFRARPTYDFIHALDQLIGGKQP
jgi:exodeoxyribonuclease V beta subunit